MLFADISANGWVLEEVYITRVCGATTWQSFFLSQSARLGALTNNGYNASANVSQIYDELDKLSCEPFDVRSQWDHDFSDIEVAFKVRLAATITQYNACLKSEKAPTFAAASNQSDFAATDVLFSNHTERSVSYPCYIAAVANMTTTGFKMTVKVKRYVG